MDALWPTLHNTPAPVPTRYVPPPPPPPPPLAPGPPLPHPLLVPPLPPRVEVEDEEEEEEDVSARAELTRTQQQLLLVVAQRDALHAALQSGVEEMERLRADQSCPACGGGKAEAAHKLRLCVSELRRCVSLATCPADSKGRPRRNSTADSAEQGKQSVGELAEGCAELSSATRHLIEQLRSSLRQKEDARVAAEDRRAAAEAEAAELRDSLDAVRRQLEEVPRLRAALESERDRSDEAVAEAASEREAKESAERHLRQLRDKYDSLRATLDTERRRAQHREKQAAEERKSAKAVGVREDVRSYQLELSRLRGQLREQRGMVHGLRDSLRRRVAEDTLATCAGGQPVPDGGFETSVARDTDPPQPRLSPTRRSIQREFI
eukprot:TRINITY_DN5329_c0_g1_i1.p1 TRINITY_DN5329_c0_g1~~TRINITY_DN5329_c0_g1_i1.p1  ORF type:complete len:396 (+),score=152.20 TRINITY_DN5329_c0_g1_i1:54-1190(+)